MTNLVIAMCMFKYQDPTGSSTVGQESWCNRKAMEFQIATAASQLPQDFRVQTLTPSLSVEYHVDNKLVLVQKNPDGTEHREPTAAMIFDAMYDLKKRSAMSSLSEISGLTGTAPAGPIKEEDEVDYSSLEWGDMDPNYRRELEQRPEVKAALQKFRHRSKIARLTPTGEFQEVDNNMPPAPNNPPALDDALKQQDVTGATLDAALKDYHEKHVQPSFNMLADSIVALSHKKAPSVLRALNLHQMQLGNLEGEICNRTVLLHNVPPFSNYSSIQYNMRYLCDAADLDFHHAVQSCSTNILSAGDAILRVVFLQQQGARQFLQSFRQKARYWRDNQDRGNDRKLRIEREVPFSTRLERQPYYALLDLLSNLTPALYESTSFQTDLNSLQIWSPESAEEELLAQVVYLPFQGEFRCLLLVQPRLLQLLNTDFGKCFNDRMMATLILLQAITNASTHSTTLAKFHHSSAFDFSNVSPEQAFHMFPYVIECHGLDAALAEKLGSDPGFIHKVYGGLGQITNTARFERGIDQVEYGKGARRKDKGKGKAKGKGKGKMSERGPTEPRSSQHRETSEDADMDNSYQQHGHRHYGEHGRRQRDVRNDRRRFSRERKPSDHFQRGRDVRDFRRDRDVRDRSPSRASNYYNSSDGYHRRH